MATKAYLKNINMQLGERLCLNKRELTENNILHAIYIVFALKKLRNAS